MSINILVKGRPILKYQWIILTILVMTLSAHLAQELCGPTPRTLNQSFLMECSRVTDGTVCERMFRPVFFFFFFLIFVFLIIHAIIMLPLANYLS